MIESSIFHAPSSPLTGRVFKIHDIFGMVLHPIMHALKGQQRLAQGKRSDTLGQSTFVSDAL